MFDCVPLGSDFVTVIFKVLLPGLNSSCSHGRFSRWYFFSDDSVVNGGAGVVMYNGPANLSVKHCSVILFVCVSLLTNP